MHTVAICVGHSRKGDEGAVSVDGTTEWDYNYRVAMTLADTLRELGCFEPIAYVVYPRKSYGAAIRWLADRLRSDGAEIAVELHFNAASPSAHGYEYLHWRHSRKGRLLAQSLLDAQSSEYPSSHNRGLKPKDRGDRGATFLRLTHCPAVICEPFFGSNETEWRLHADEQGRLAMCYADGIARYFSRIARP